MKVIIVKNLGLPRYNKCIGKIYETTDKTVPGMLYYIFTEDGEEVVWSHEEVQEIDIEEGD